MQLLDAVNYVLPKLGEHQVTSLDARSPTLRILLQLFDAHRLAVLNRGWWFNQGTHTLPLNPASEIDVPVNTLSISVPTEPNIGHFDGRLFNAGTQSFKFDKAVEAMLIVDVQWDALPYAVQEWVKYEVLLDQLVTDQGLTQEYNVWADKRTLAERQVLAEHLRVKQYSAKTSRRGRRIISAIRGH